MPHYINADILRNEIKRLKGQLIRGACAAQIEMRTMCKEEAYDEVLSFLSTLESEKPMNQDGLEEELDKWRHNHFEGERDGHYSGEYLTRDSQLDLARHFAEWGAKHAKIDVTDFCKPIDPGIAQCIADHSWEMLGEDEKPVPNDLEEAAEDYIKKGRYLPEAFVVRPAFIAGAKWQKEQMLREAVEGTYNNSDWGTPCIDLPSPLELERFDKIRIIILTQKKGIE